MRELANNDMCRENSSDLDLTVLNQTIGVQIGKKVKSIKSSELTEHSSEQTS